MNNILLVLIIIPFLTSGQTFEEIEININNPKENFNISGTLTRPKGSNDFKIGILITDAGQTDRDETIGKHKIFKDLAHKLANEGIATYRYDDRGGYKSGGPNEINSTPEQLASDAQVVFFYLQKLFSDNPIGFIGHCEGGNLAALASIKTPKTDFLISLAGMATNGKDFLIQRNYDLFNALKVPEKDINEYISSYFSPLLDYIIKEADKSKKMKFILDSSKEYRENHPNAAQILTNNTSYRNAVTMFQELDDPWLISFLKTDPTVWQKVGCRTLALNGSLDVQVSYVSDLLAIKKLKKENITCKILENHNHLFQIAKTGSTKEYDIINEGISAETIKIIADFIKSN